MVSVVLGLLYLTISLKIDAIAESYVSSDNCTEERYTCLQPVEENGMWGYCDDLGNWILPPQWTAAGWFRDHTAAVRSVDKKWGIIDNQGRYLVPCEFDSIQDQYSYYYTYSPCENPLNYIGGLSDGFYLIVNLIEEVEVMGFYCIDTHTLVQPQWDAVYIAEADYGSNELILVLDGECGFGYVDRYGNIVIPCQYEWAEPFIDGVALVDTLKNGEHIEFYIDISGNRVENASQNTHELCGP